jgi:membrane-associated phospholipid phosphatase
VVILRGAVRHAIRPTRQNLLHWASWAVALALELALLAVLRDGEIYGWEQSLTRSLQEVPGRQAVFDITSTLTNTLSTPFLLIFATIAGIVVISGHRWVALLLLLSFPLHVLAQFPKALVDRPRPSDAFDGIDGVGGFQSFPSGHAEYVITFYGFLAYFLVLHAPGRWHRTAIVAAWVAFTLATGSAGWRWVATGHSTSSPPTSWDRVALRPHLAPLSPPPVAGGAGVRRGV